MKLHAPIETYLNTVRETCPQVKEPALNFLRQRLTITTLAVKQYYVQAHTLQKSVGFVFSGLLRAYYVDRLGDEVTIRFAKENTFATDYVAFLNQTPSRYLFQCLENTVMVNIPYTVMQEAYVRFPSLERYGRLIAEELFKSQQKRIESFLFESAVQRYSHFLLENPTLVNRISLSYLSSYLGIARPSLSRIRRKIMHP